MRNWDVLRPLRTDRGRAKLLLSVVTVVGIVGTVWLSRQSYSVYKLTRGVGDTWFHTADGKRWFRLDEQRHDVPIAAISPHLQQCVRRRRRPSLLPASRASTLSRSAAPSFAMCVSPAPSRAAAR